MGRTIRILNKTEEIYARRLYMAGATVAQVGIVFGMTKGMASGKLRRLGLSNIVRPPADVQLMAKIIDEIAIIEKSKPTEMEWFEEKLAYAVKLGLPHPKRPGRKRKAKIVAKPSAPAPLRHPPPPMAADFEEGREVIEWKGAADAIGRIRPRQCRWPSGNPSSNDFRFCCRPVEDIKKPYCEEHSKAALDPRYVKENVK